MKLEYLVTGTGRCGTVFMARLLTSVGVLCGHESVFNWSGLHHALMRLRGEEPLDLSHASKVHFQDGQNVKAEIWLPNVQDIIAEASYMAAPFLCRDFLEYTKVIHVVRNPCRVVNSFVNYIQYFVSDHPSTSYEQLIYRTLPMLKTKMPAYDRAALYWIEWNKLIEARKANLFFRVEEDPKAVIDFVKGVGEPFNDPSINSYRRPGTDRFLPDKIESKEILERFEKLAKEYGYDLSLEYLML